MQKIVRLLCDVVWPAVLAIAALLGFLFVRGYQQLMCLPPDITKGSPDIHYLLSSNITSAYLLFGLVWGAFLEQFLTLARRRFDVVPGVAVRLMTIAVWVWCIGATAAAVVLAVRQC